MCLKVKRFLWKFLLKYKFSADWLHLLKKSLEKNFVFSAVFETYQTNFVFHTNSC